VSWYKNGIQFECQGSGKCCQSRGEFGYVYLTEEDLVAAAKAKKLSVKKFKAQYCKLVDGHLALKDNPNSPDCVFLKDRRCGIYEGRPTQCRTWPFWPEVMGAKTWAKSVASFCPGVGQGRTYSATEIQSILKVQKTADRRLQRA
jgi:uncharacterized protein